MALTTALLIKCEPMADPHDVVGVVLALGARMPEFILVFYLIATACWQDLHAPTAIIGELLNIKLNRILKRAFKKQRPPSAPKEGPGMPSNHSQIASFFAVHMIASVLPSFDSESDVFQPLDTLALTTIGGLSLMVAFVCVSRVYFGYHTPEQVLVGAIVGAVAGVLWLMVPQLLSSIVPSSIVA